VIGPLGTYPENIAVEVHKLHVEVPDLRPSSLLLEQVSPVEYAHDRGIVPRDLKPGNMKVTREAWLPPHTSDRTSRC